jgi:hypothetical protein
MAFDPVLIGTTANDGTGDPLRTAFTRVNSNFNVAVEGPATTPVTDNTTVVFDSTSGRLVKQAGAAVAAEAGKFAPTGNITAGNGMYLPAGNTVAFSTAGAERLRVQSIVQPVSNHNVFVQIPTPATANTDFGLSIGNSVEFLNTAATTSLNVFANVGAGTAAGSKTAGMRLVTRNNGNTGALIPAQIVLQKIADDNAGNIQFIASGGSIFGNGDTAASPAVANLRGTNASGTNVAGPAMTIQAGRGTGDQAGGSLSFQTAAAGSSGPTLNAATTRLFINSAGDVGIGTTSPGAQLQVGTVTALTGGPGVAIPGFATQRGIWQWFQTPEDAGTYTITLSRASGAIGGVILDVDIAGFFSTTNREGWAAYRVYTQRVTTDVIVDTVKAPTNAAGASFTNSFTFTVTKPDQATINIAIGKPSGGAYFIGIKGFVLSVAGSSPTTISTSFV